MKKLILILALLIFCLSVRSQHLYMRQDLSNQTIESLIKDNGISEFRIFTESKFLTNDNLDLKKLEKSIVEAIPNPKDSGFLVLNWEGDGLKELFSQKNNVKFANYIQQYVEALRFVKKLRPQIKCAYYNIPFPRYEFTDRYYAQRIDKLNKIIREQDFLAPSMYIRYPKSITKNREYIRANMEFALRAAKQYNKPIYPFVWHRVNPIDKNNAWQLVPLNIFKETIKEVLNANYGNKKVNGIFWWHSENNVFSKRATTGEFKSISNREEYLKTLFMRYYQTIGSLTK